MSLGVYGCAWCEKAMFIADFDVVGTIKRSTKLSTARSRNSPSLSNAGGRPQSNVREMPTLRLICRAESSPTVQWSSSFT